MENKSRGVKYDSELEKKLHKKELKGWKYHAVSIPYIIESSYEPDFIKKLGKVEYLIEVKGYFRNKEEAKKYKWINKTLTETQKLVFIFSYADKPLPWAIKRKDKSRMTHGEWATKNGFDYYCLKTKKNYGTEKLFSS